MMIADSARVVSEDEGEAEEPQKLESKEDIRNFIQQMM